MSALYLSKKLFLFLKKTISGWPFCFITSFMPQVDLETLVTACAGGGADRKIACETLADGGDDQASTENDDIPDEDHSRDVPPDFPPESFWLSKDKEYDWFDRNAFYERKDSTKGNANSTTLNPHSNHNSQRFTVNLKSKASIIGLPKTQKTTFVDSSRRTCKSANIRLFPKRSASVGKSAVPFTEPGSPKVSCMGRVRSKRARRRSNSLKRGEKLSEKSKGACREKPSEKSKPGDDKKKKKTGFYSKVMSIFRSKKTPKKPSGSGSRKLVETLDEKPEVIEPQRQSASVQALSEPPGLGGMKRFASGRQSGSWTAEDFNHVASQSLDIDRRVCVMGRS